ncbi:PepSY domain-containing protein [Actinokineospora terrae]|uniref:Peptidase propeptide and YPEB domain-containing protein n=1 Tax=Actinokineospora terrae TaxID=155974 RepID=A0A1H9T2P8_9PSEU|nr:PepSY domain-containing protein [Actinokineospora terrae]SER91347.1 Peptidase propeptide and YPEB domain-containing protein [Actinokineospora terrae]
MNPPRRGIRRWTGIVAAGTVVAGGLLLGVITTAGAQTETTAPSSPSATPQPTDGSGQGNRPNETPLTGADADKAKAAALAKYPGATVDRVETDSDGVYEAHITTTDGKHITLKLDKNFAVTGEETGRTGGRHGGGTLLTGADADKAKAAALAKYPGATVDRVETDSDGVYEAHITTTDGKHITLKLDKNFTITGEKTGRGGGHGGRGNSNETPLTGADADKAKAAALAKYPGATVDRVETDSDGAYEAHITTTDGKRVTVELDKNFTVTGEETGHGPK